MCEEKCTPDQRISEYPFKHQCNTMHTFSKAAYCTSIIVLKIGGSIIYEELLFQHYLQCYSETTRPTEIQSCLWVHRQICCYKISSMAYQKL